MKKCVSLTQKIKFNRIAGTTTSFKTHKRIALVNIVNNRENFNTFNTSYHSNINDLDKINELKNDNSYRIHSFLSHLDFSVLKIPFVRDLNKKLLILEQLRKANIVTNCMNKLSKDSKIKINLKTKKYSLNEFSKCKNSYCPICSKKKTFEIKFLLESLLNENKDNSNLFTTFTIPHLKSIDSSVLYSLLNDSFKDLLKHNDYKNNMTKIYNKSAKNKESQRKVNRDDVQGIKKRFGITGIFKNLDVTFNFNRVGDNYHLPCIFFSNRRLTDVEIKLFTSKMNKLFIKIFYKKANQLKTYNGKNLLEFYNENFDMRDIKKHAVFVRDSQSWSYNIISKYISDNLSLESTTHISKQTRTIENYNINDLYSFLIDSKKSPVPYNELIAKISNFFSIIHNRRLTQFLNLDSNMKNILNESKQKLDNNKKRFLESLKMDSKLNDLRNNLYTNNVLNTIKKHCLKQSKHLEGVNIPPRKKVLNKRVLRAKKQIEQIEQIDNNFFSINSKNEHLRIFKTVENVDITTFNGILTNSS